MFKRIRNPLKKNLSNPKDKATRIIRGNAMHRKRFLKCLRIMLSYIAVIATLIIHKRSLNVKMKHKSNSRTSLQ